MTLISCRATARHPAVLAGCLMTAVLVGGCASVLQGADTSGGGETDEQTPPAHDHATGPEDVLVSIKSAGALGPVGYDLRNPAEFMLLGDGTAIAGGVIDAIYPGPAVLPLQSATLAEGQIQELLTAADEAGILDGSLDYGEPGVTDMSTTTVALTVDGQTVAQTVYALGYIEDRTLSDSERAAREALQSFVDAAHATVDASSEQYLPSAVAVYRLTGDEVAVEPGLEQRPLPWPIATVPPPLAATGTPRSCAIIARAEAAQLLLDLAGANELTPWLIGADPPAYLAFRPLLPDEVGCEL